MSSSDDKDKEMLSALAERLKQPASPQDEIKALEELNAWVFSNTDGEVTKQRMPAVSEAGLLKLLFQTLGRPLGPLDEETAAAEALLSEDEAPGLGKLKFQLRAQLLVLRTLVDHVKDGGLCLFIVPRTACAPLALAPEVDCIGNYVKQLQHLHAVPLASLPSGIAELLADVVAALADLIPRLLIKPDVSYSNLDLDQDHVRKVGCISCSSFARYSNLAHWSARACRACHTKCTQLSLQPTPARSVHPAAAGSIQLRPPPYKQTPNYNTHCIYASLTGA